MTMSVATRDKLLKLINERAQMRPLVVSYVLKSKSDAKIISCYFVEMSQWFTVTPLPDDEWEIEVKTENKFLLLKAVGEMMGLTYGSEFTNG